MRIASVFSILLGCCLTLTACGSSQEAAPDIVKKDISTWALPLDPYQDPPISLLGYASDLVRADCLKNAGFEYPVVPYNENAPTKATRNEVGRRLFNPDIARSFGYHEPRSQRISEKELQERQEPTGSEYIQAADKCEALVADAGIDWEEFSNKTAQEIAWNLAPEKNKTVVAATQRWRECMMPLGIPALPDTPDKMPGEVLHNTFGLETASSWDSPSASAEEIRIATADAECRESSGYSQALYDAEFAAQEKAVAEHATELAPLLERNRKSLEAARKIIAERG
ncbi:MAG: hypothetical protein Q4B10_06755 [Actinomycetaceae bacterium]|nr:hypothetical protein [Actinomycetaceae bacterium]